MIILKRKQVLLEPIYDPDYYNTHTKLIKIPPQGKERCDQGIIKRMGLDCDPAFKVGMHVIFSGYSGTTVVVDNEVQILIHSDFLKAGIEDIIYPVNGLYHKAKDGSFFPATYESVFPLLVESYMEHISPHIDIKKEEETTQRDPIDERNR